MTFANCPILKLPAVVLQELFAMMNIEEIYNFSFCSKMSQKILKMFCRTKFSLGVLIGCDMNFYLSLDGDYNSVRYFRLSDTFFGHEIHNHVTHPKREEILDFPLDNRNSAPVSRILTVIDHFLNSFCCKIGELYLEPNCIQGELQNLIKSILHRQSSFPGLSIHGFINLEKLAFLNENIQFSWQSEDLEIEYGDLLFIETFLSFRSATCEISKSNFSPKDWKVLISAWMNGWNPKMKHLLVRGNYDFSEITKDLTVGQLRDKEVVRKLYYNTFIDDWGFDVSGGYDIQRKSDGMIATVYVMDGFERVDFHVWN